MELFAAATAASAVAGYALFIWPTQWVKIETVRFPLGIGKRILQISDLHVDMLRVSPRRLEGIISSAAPDYIMLTGDYTFDPRRLPKLARYLEAIAGGGVPAYAVLGNHDYVLPRIGELIALFSRHGIRVLRNESAELPEFRLVGIDDFSTGRSRIGKAMSGGTAGKPVLIITHDPNAVLYIRKPFDYLMAGHFHGKQLNVPGFFKLKPKGPLAAAGIYKGLHRSEFGSFYISKGIGQAGVNARFMVRSEVTLHEL